ncbi:MAG: carbamoyltransferase [Candidatus Omnitrophica bacterium]|nr:carbamoyltransferase [Candidatus Omnitrophota bacterium]
MYILGISCYYHDSAACLLKDAEVIVAAQEERFSRIKHDLSFPMNAIRFCLDYAGIKGNELDYAVFNEKPFLKFERIIKTFLSTYPRSAAVFQEAMINWMADKLWIKSLIEEKLGISSKKVLFCQHHISHAASSLFCSPFLEAAIFSVDGAGEWTTTSLGRGTAAWDNKDKSDIQLFEEIKFPHSLGLLYSVFTAFLGFKVNEGEYKVMGMSAFGKPKYVDKIYELIRVNQDGSFRMNMKYFAYHYHTKQSFNKHFEDLFGRPRDPKSRFVTDKTSIYDYVNLPTESEIKANQYYADIAASIQKVTEDILVRIANYLYQKTGLKKLCLAGGVALNCLANSRILRETPFEEIFIQPAAGDSGAAMGAALYVYHCLLAKPRKFILKHAYWGKEYSRDDIKSFLESAGIKYKYIEDEEELIGLVVEMLISAKVVGWFQGRFEWGPRALGNRSILADPRDEKMKDIVNIKIKFREPFRPFAPSVLSEKAAELFELNNSQEHYPMKFMLYTLPVKKKELIPAVTHVDGSSRIQIVDKQINPRYYRLIERFYQVTGVPAVLNTSFNLKGEPIVESPQDAFNTFSRSEMDMLVLGNFILTKNTDNRRPN